jgi:gas vesicle protein
VKNANELTPEMMGGSMDPEQQAYVDNMKAKLHAWKAEIEELRSKVHEQKAQTEADTADLIDDLSRRQKEVEAKLEKLANTGEEAYDELKEGVRSAADELKSALARSKAKLQ